MAGAELARVQPMTPGIELHTLTMIHSPKQQGDVALKLHVASIYFKCSNVLEVRCKCFISMLKK
jgi:hypothetical protein